MTFERRDIERAITKAMGEKPGGKYLHEDTEDNRRFIAWGRSQMLKLDDEQQEVYDMIRQCRGTRDRAVLVPKGDGRLLQVGQCWCYEDSMDQVHGETMETAEAARVEFMDPDDPHAITPYCIQAMRQLLRTGAWSANAKGSLVHVRGDACLLEWDAGAADVVKLIEGWGWPEALKGMLQGDGASAERLAAILVDVSIFARNGYGTAWWVMQAHEGERARSVVKITNPLIILDEKALASLPLRDGTATVTEVARPGG